MSRRPTKAGGPSSSRNTITVDDSTDGLQDLAAFERQLNSDNNDDALEGSNIQTLQKQVQTLTQNQSQSDTILQQILAKINELSNLEQAPNPGSQAPRSTVSYHDQERDTPTRDTLASTNSSNSQQYTKKLPDLAPLLNSKEMAYLS